LKVLGNIKRLWNKSKNKIKPSSSFDGRKQSINISVMSPVKSPEKSPERRGSISKKEKQFEWNIWKTVAANDLCY